MVYLKNTSSVTPVTTNYDVDIAQLYNRIQSVENSLSVLSSRYKLVSANSYSVNCPKLQPGAETHVTITIRRTIQNTMLIPVLKSTGWCTVSNMSWFNEPSGDRQLEVNFLNVSPSAHSTVANICVLEFLK